MKTVSIILKIVVALAAIAGIVYIAATYGDKIVAWCKNLINNKCRFFCNCGCTCEDVEEEIPTVAETDFEG
ncbi:MAG: hypothetical protein IJA45_05375 [Oscillospiraceae bacterium]|nr:hypothetical protein [Oscillospiraceae bacterium]